MQSHVIELSTHVAYDRDALQTHLKTIIGSLSDEALFYRIVKRSLDARQNPLKIRLLIHTYKDEIEYREHHPEPLRLREVPRSAQTLLIVGAGPAGLFAALRAISLGLKPIILERGKSVRMRRRDLAQLNRHGLVDSDSNYCFGEGGAGTYSDGKLYTRAKKRGAVSAILQLLVQYGAPEEILFEAHPHIGTNRLPKVIEAIREAIIEQGGEVRFGSKVVDLMISSTSQGRTLDGIILESGEVIAGEAGVILATGHSARDIFELLKLRDVEIEAKPFAVGVRIEHPQRLIDHNQYHGNRPVELGSASYKLVTQVDGRGVFSFCMCPGGIIAPAATRPGEVVVNGWSPYQRNGRFANSGLVVSVSDEDFAPFAEHEGDPLAGLRFQSEIEGRAFHAAGGLGVTAPAQRARDFLRGKTSETLPECSYIPGVASTDLREVLPPQVVTRLVGGLNAFERRINGYTGADAMLVGVESRTSSPVRIPRERITLQHPSLTKLFPCGEGAGYAGGIVSAALDGFRCAEAAAQGKTVLEDLWINVLNQYSSRGEG